MDYIDNAHSPGIVSLFPRTHNEAISIIRPPFLVYSGRGLVEDIIYLYVNGM